MHRHAWEVGREVVKISDPKNQSLMQRVGPTAADIAVTGGALVALSVVLGVAVGVGLELLFVAVVLPPALGLLVEGVLPLPGGRTTKGVVSGHERRRDSEGSQMWKQFYEFEVDGTTVEFSRPGLASWRDKLGSTIRVSYLPLNPSRARHIWSRKNLTFAAPFVLVPLIVGVTVHPIAGPGFVLSVLVAYAIVRHRWAMRLAASNGDLPNQQFLPIRSQAEVISGDVIPAATLENRGF